MTQKHVKPRNKLNEGRFVYAAWRIHCIGAFLTSSPGMVVMFRDTALGNWLISWFRKSSLRSYAFPRWINTLFWSHWRYGVMLIVIKWWRSNLSCDLRKVIWLPGVNKANTAGWGGWHCKFLSSKERSSLFHCPDTAYYGRLTHLINTEAVNSGCYFCTNPQCCCSRCDC